LTALRLSDDAGVIANKSVIVIGIEIHTIEVNVTTMMQAMTSRTIHPLRTIDAAAAIEANEVTKIETEALGTALVVNAQTHNHWTGILAQLEIELVIRGARILSAAAARGNLGGAMIAQALTPRLTYRRDLTRKAERGIAHVGMMRGVPSRIFLPKSWMRYLEGCLGEARRGIDLVHRCGNTMVRAFSKSTVKTVWGMTYDRYDLMT